MAFSDTAPDPASHLDPVICYALDGRGAASPADPHALRADDPAPAPQPAQGPARDPFIWLHMQREDPRTRPWLERESGLDSYIRAALLAADTRPRCAEHGDGVVMILRGINMMEGAEPEDMVSVRLWIDPARVIGVWLRPLHAVGDLVGAIERGAAPVSPGDLVARLAQKLVDRMEPVVAELHDEIDDFEDALLDAKGEVERGVLADLRRRAIRLRRYIGPQREALATLAVEEMDWLSDRDRSRLREAADKTTRILEDLDAARERASVVQDQIMEMRAERMGRYTLLLSVVAAIFLPLSLIAGLLGANVGGIPGETYPWAFAIVVVGLVVIAGLEIWLFKAMKLF